MRNVSAIRQIKSKYRRLAPKRRIDTIAIPHLDLECMPNPSRSRAIGFGFFRVASNCELGDHMP